MIVLKFFTAPWCETCHQVKPIIVAKAKAAGITLEEYDVLFKEDALEASRWFVSIFPALVEFEDEKPIRSLVGSEVAKWEPR